MYVVYRKKQWFIIASKDIEVKEKGTLVYRRAALIKADRPASLDRQPSPYRKKVSPLTNSQLEDNERMG